MARAPAGKLWPIVTLTTDFGLHDSYVAEVKAVLLKQLGRVSLVDVTHLIQPGDVLGASIALERAVAAFEPGTVHLAVIDPGVGSERRILVIEIGGQFVVCPDNGLITWTWRRHPGGRAHELTWRPATASRTFHGRDIMAPAAAMLAGGNKLSQIARPIIDPILLDLALAEQEDAMVIHFDRFGNATTNLPEEAIIESGSVRVGRFKLGRVRQTYADVSSGKPLALIGSSGLLEIAVRDGSAEESLKLKIGDAVRIE